MDKFLSYITCSIQTLLEQIDRWVTVKWPVHCTLHEVQLPNCAKLQFPLQKMIAF